MKKTLLTFALIFAAVLYAAPQKVERFLLVAGANNGGTDRVKLRYAETDAESFATVMSQMGGVAQKNVIKLKGPNAAAINSSFAELENRLKNKEQGVRKEVFVYYSGHADEKGLRIGNDIYSWAEFRKNVSELNADVKVAVLDACGSGSITRIKGGVSRPAFLQDASNEMRGYAFLTSSNENEASQESDRIKGSFFTHALVSGLRGAADMTGNGEVTLNEAYQFAFNETLQSTQNTSGGTQHPNRDMNLVGTGDIVVTDVKETAAGLVLEKDLEGRFFIRDSKGNLVAELYKIAGKPMELGLAAGTYSVQMEAPSRLWKASDITLADGKKQTISMNSMKSISIEVAVARGNTDSTAYDGLDSARKAPFEFDVNFYNATEIPGRGVQLGLFVNNAGKEYSGTQISLISNIAQKDMEGVQVNPLSNIAIGNNIYGAQITSGLNVAKNINGAQVSAAFNVGGNVKGAQVTSGFNVTHGSFTGVQAGPFNISVDGGKGVQGGVVNISADSIDGGQGGVMNFAKDVSVAQGGIVNVSRYAGKTQGGIINIAKKTEYVQGGIMNISAEAGKVQGGIINASGKVYVQGGIMNVGAIPKVQGGVWNTAGKVDYLQGGVWNVAGKVGVTQIGIWNVAGKVGRQVGIFNISGHSEKTPIGLINIVGNGIFDATFYADEAGGAGVTLHTGTPYMYTLFEYNQRIGGDGFGEWPKSWGMGLGTRFGMKGSFFNLDYAFLNAYDSKPHSFNIGPNIDKKDETNFLHKVRLGGAFKFLPGIALTSGISMNILTEGYGKENEFVLEPKGEWHWHWKVGDHKARIWPGVYAGLTVGKF